MKDTIREKTPSMINRSIDEQTLEHLERYKNASREQIEHRLKVLDREWDMERVVAAVGAAVSLGGSALGLRNRRFLSVPLVAQGLVLWHSLPIPDPLTPVFRSLGIWTRQEIERERHALKLLRGDYERVEKSHTAKSALAASQGEYGLKEATADVPLSRKREVKEHEHGKVPVVETEPIESPPTTRH